METESIIKLNFSNFEIFSTDQAGNQNITYSSDSLQHKKIKIDGFAISLLTSNDLKMNDSSIKIKKAPESNKSVITNQNMDFSPKNASNVNTTTIRKKPGVHIDFLREEYTEKTYKLLKEFKSVPYLIRPLDIRLQIQIKTKKNSANSEPKMKFWLKFKTPLMIILNKQQKEYLTNMGKHLKSLEMIRSNLHIRPTVLFRNNRLEWFRYAVKAVIEQNKKLKLNFKKSSQKLSLQNKYINLYKKKQKIVIYLFLFFKKMLILIDCRSRHIGMGN